MLAACSYNSIAGFRRFRHFHTIHSSKTWNVFRKQLFLIYEQLNALLKITYPKPIRMNRNLRNDRLQLKLKCIALSTLIGRWLLRFIVNNFIFGKNVSSSWHKLHFHVHTIYRRFLYVREIAVDCSCIRIISSQR